MIGVLLQGNGWDRHESISATFMLTFTLWHKIFHQATNLSIKLPHVTRPALFIIVIPCNKTCYLCLGGDSIEKKKSVKAVTDGFLDLGTVKTILNTQATKKKQTKYYSERQSIGNHPYRKGPHFEIKLNLSRQFSRVPLRLKLHVFLFVCFFPDGAVRVPATCEKWRYAKKKSEG